MLTLIIGKQSNLSKQINIKLDNSILISSRELTDNIKLLDKYKNQKINIIFNNFQSASMINDISQEYKYIQQSIGITAMVLSYIKNWNINKIIYSSSSSVYGNNSYCNESDTLQPISLHASLKISNEFLLTQHCKKYNIEYTIIRIFNMYGRDDDFSVISKIISAYKNDTILNIVNEGKGIRDFIHIDDVVDIILKLIFIKDITILNLGTGDEKSINNIIEYLKKNDIFIKTNNIIIENEIKISISDSEKLLRIMDNQFIDVEEYILDTIKEKN